MSNVKTKLRNNLASILVFGGMGIYGLSIPSAAYLHHIQPEKPQIASEYQSLSQELHYLRSTKQFSLEETLDSKLMEEYICQVDSLSAKITDIESSEDFTSISRYEEDKKRHNRYWPIPIFSGIFGVISMMYGIHVESKINSRLSKK